MATLYPQHCLNPSRHTLNQPLTYICINLVPFLLHPLPQLLYPTWCPLILPQLPLQMIPQVFNGIEVWRLCWPREDPETIVLKPTLGLLAGVLGVIVLLEDDITCGFAKVSDAFLKVLLQDLEVEVPIHPPINFACILNTIPQHAAPHHQRSTTKLQGPLH
jgi:hypothetical protein